MSNKTLQLKKALIEAMTKTLGVVTDACMMVGTSRFTYYEYYNKDEKFREEIDDLKNVALDFAESKLFENIKDGDTTSIIFYLKTQGKKRGYIERQEYTGKDGENLFNSDISGESAIDRINKIIASKKAD